MLCKKEFGKRNEKVPDRWNWNNLTYAILLFAMLFLASNSVYAITGSGGTISLNSEIGSVSYDGVSSGLNAYGGSSTIYGLFTSTNNVTSVYGRLGLLGSSDGSALDLVVSNPLSDTIISGTTANFNYIPSGPIIDCSLYIDNVSRGYNAYPVINATNSFSAFNLAIGKHFWNISCTYGLSELSKAGEFTMIYSAGFDSNSTHLNGVNASAVPNLTLSKSAGKIVFSGNTDLSNGIDLSKHIRISPLSIYVDSAAAPMLNKSATLTMNAVPFNNVVIWRDGAVCTDCSVISLSSNTLVFSVTGFSEYTVTSTSKLETYDSSDSSRVLQNGSIMFTANYTNITSGVPITASCDIIILGDGTHLMTYNATSLTHQYTSSFIDAGTKSYTVQCTPTDSGFDALSVDASFAISTLPPVTFADTKITTGPTSTMNVSNDAATIYAGASNTTELVFDAETVTKTWQGYYGNVVGNVTLSDANSNSMYNWEDVSPNGEIYAVRSPSVNWETIRCANLAELQVENVVLGVDESAADSVTNTFSNTSNFNKFFAGNVQINTSQNCYSTHLNDNTGVQSTKYAELLLSDSTLIIYTTLIDPNATGFDGNKYNFEMLVGENGHDGNNVAPTTYYFYIEIG